MALSFSDSETVDFRLEKLIFWLLLAVLLWAPIPLGSNRAWAWSLLEIAVFVLVGAWLLFWAVGRAEVSESLAGSWPAFALLAIWLAHIVISFVPLPPSWVELLSPESARMQHLTDAIGVKRDTMTLSVDPSASQGFLLKSLAYTGVFFLVLAVVNNRARVMTLPRVLVYGAVV